MLRSRAVRAPTRAHEERWTSPSGNAPLGSSITSPTDPTRRTARLWAVLLRVPFDHVGQHQEEGTAARSGGNGTPP